MWFNLAFKGLIEVGRCHVADHKSILFLVGCGEVKSTTGIRNFNSRRGQVMTADEDWSVSDRRSDTDQSSSAVITWPLRKLKFLIPVVDLTSPQPTRNKIDLWSATWQRPTSMQPITPCSRFRISNWRRYAIRHIQPDLAPRRLSSLLAPKRRTTSTSLQIGWGGKGGGTFFDVLLTRASQYNLNN